MSKINLQDFLGVKKVSDNKYVGVRPLMKPEKASRGVFGGYIAAQALVVAMKSSPEGFRPHSLHSFFLKPGRDDIPMEWSVENINNGKNFCNRSIHGAQGGEIKYIANISLTKRNSYQKTVEEYEKQEQLKKEREKNASADDDDDDDDDDNEMALPFRFQTPYPKVLENRKQEQLELDPKGAHFHIAYKIPDEMIDLDLTKEEDDMPVTERRLSYYVKLGHDTNFEINGLQDQYAALAAVSDSLFLTRLARILRIPGLDLNQVAHYLSTSIDHVIYFHDDDFDVSDWIAFSFHTLRFAERRVLVEAELFNKKGVHVATVIQEGYVFFNGIEKDAKL